MMNEQYLITYNVKGCAPKTFPITKEQYELELDYLVKISDYNPNKATADYADETTDEYTRNVEVISFYDPEDTDFADIQLVKITTITRG